MASMLPVLLTRPAAASERFAARLREAGADRVVISPLLEIVPSAAALPDIPGGVLLTSAEGARAYRRLGGPPGRPAWVVGPRTAEAARAAGLDVRGTAPDAAALARAVPRPPAGGPPLTHLRGAVQRGDLVARLRARGIPTEEAVLYDQRPRPPSAEARALLAGPGPLAAPVFSPRSAALLREALPAGALARLRVAAISAAAAAPLAPAPTRLAESPDGEAMLRAVLSWLRPEGRP
jgi:uroporphyrinogen-III synthase